VTKFLKILIPEDNILNHHKFRTNMKEKILVIDDDATFLRSLKKILTLKKYFVDTADCVQQAESFLEENSYSCILLDVKMPDVKDLDLLKRFLEITLSRR
jgi:DNA-binding NtrC family response regulator